MKDWWDFIESARKRNIKAPGLVYKEPNSRRRGGLILLSMALESWDVLRARQRGGCVLGCAVTWQRTSAIEARICIVVWPAASAASSWSSEHTRTHTAWCSNDDETSYSATFLMSTFAHNNRHMSISSRLTYLLPSSIFFNESPLLHARGWYMMRMWRRKQNQILFSR
jgi:hypothetical protein